MLWWPKTGQITQHKTLAERLGRDGSTVTGVVAKVSSRRIVRIVGSQERTRKIAALKSTGARRIATKITTATPDSRVMARSWSGWIRLINWTWHIPLSIIGYTTDSKLNWKCPVRKALSKNLMPWGVLKKHCPSPVDLSTVVWEGTTVALSVSRRDSLGTQNLQGESDDGVWGKADRTRTLEAWQFLALWGGGTFEWLAFLPRIREPQYERISTVYWCTFWATRRLQEPWFNSIRLVLMLLLLYGGLITWFPASQPAHSPEQGSNWTSVAIHQTPI
jgi:hypothetical protein